MLLRSGFLLVASLVAARAGEPTGYYARAEGLTGGPLRAALHEIVRGHVVIPYAQLHGPLARLHEDPANPANVILLYSADSVPKGSDFNSAAWNREHAWPRSRGNADQQGSDDSDLHYIWPAYDGVNSARGNLYFDLSDRADPGFRSPAHPLAPRTSLDADSWEPPPGQRGAIARALFYVAVRYEGDEASTSDMELVSYVPRGSQMGNLNTLLRWHAEEPVTDAERRRNDLVHSDYQRNRNPFIDHPEWVSLIWGEPLPGAAGTRPIAWITATAANASEQPAFPGEFRITLSQAAPPAGVRLDLRLSGTAVAALDYALSGPGVSFQAAEPAATVLLPGGATSASLTLVPFPDGSAEPPETAAVVLEPGLGYTVVPNGSQQATVTINDLPVLPATWSFDAGAPFPPVLPAETGNARLSFEPWRGTVTSFSGVTGDALALVGSDGNGSAVLLSFSMAGQRDLGVAFQTRGTSTGFSSGTWDWSTDGTTFNALPGVNTASTSSTFATRTIDFSAVAALNGAPTVTLRYTLSGATSASGNNRIDNLSLAARPASTAPDAAPQILSQPATITGVTGGSLGVFVNATGRPAPSYQWFKDNVRLAGATGAAVTVPLASLADAGTYHVTVANPAGATTSLPITVRIVPAAARLINVATRALAGAGDTSLIAGFVIGGPGPQDVLIRGAGPALAAFGVTNALPDPQIGLFAGSDQIATNDDWAVEQSGIHASAGAFTFAAGSKDAALVQRLAPGAYTVQLTASSKTGGNAGVALVEVFEVGPRDAATTAARLVNLSSRAFVGAGQDILIPGLVIAAPGTDATSNRLLLVRAVGPGLADFGISGTLARPRIVVLDRVGIPIAENIGWQSAAHREALVSATTRVGAFPLSGTRADSALLVSLGSAPHTIQVSGADGGTGVALVEVYEVP